MKYSILFISLFVLQVAFGQDTYYKSFIITPSNDTIKGFISNVYDAKTIKFKKQKDDKPTVFTPKLLRGFILDDNVFETKIINIPYYKYSTVSLADQMNHITKDTERHRMIDTLFLQKLVQGTASLYKLKNKESFTYFFLQKGNVLHELPPQYVTITEDPNAVMKMINQLNSGIISDNSLSARVNVHYDYLDTLGIVLNDKRFLTLPTNRFIYSQRSLSTYVSLYNKKKGIPNGGLLKSKVSRKIFTGINIGILSVDYDDIIEASEMRNSFAFKLYGLFPMSGMDRNIFAKFAFNYFTYSSSYDKKSIPSASFGLRYSGTSGWFRPYFETSIAVASMNVNNRPTDYGFPLILELGANVPIKNYFISASMSRTPILVYKLNGYKFWAFNLGFMF